MGCLSTCHYMWCALCLCYASGVPGSSLLNNFPIPQQLYFVSDSASEIYFKKVGRAYISRTPNVVAPLRL